MKKKDSRGFMLAETLIVTTFVAGVLIFLFMEFSRLNSSYNEYYTYNTTESLYALEDIKDYILADSSAANYIDLNIEDLGYIDITDCEIFTHQDYCLRLFELENIERILVTENNIQSDLDIQDGSLLRFINKIDSSGSETYRLVAEFENETFATLRMNLT